MNPSRDESTTKPGAVVPRSAFTVDQFAKEHGISRTRYFALQKEGLGPRTFKVGARTLISTEAAAEWRAKMEQRSSEAAPAPAPSPATRKRLAMIKQPKPSH